MAQLLSKPDIALASAIQQESDSPTQLEHVRVLLSNLSIDCEMEFLPGRNLCLSRETFEKTGGFPPELVTCEDYVFTQKASEFGKLFYTSQAQYVHLGEDKAFWPMAKKEVWRGQSNLASIKGRKVPMSEVPSFIAPPLFTGGLLVFLIAVILSFYALAYLAILGSSFILLVYSLRLFKKRQRCPSLFAIVAFYSLYFPARTIGTVFGAIKTLDSGVFKQ
jgi:GT2 family glycosyltransferase